MAKVRFYWVDWMKVIGMFLIIWGHLFPKHSCDFIYSFNVPLFFCISGFLEGGAAKTKTSYGSLFNYLCNLFSY